MNFGVIMKLKQAWDKLLENHPKLPQFISAIQSKKIVEGTVITINIAYPDGSNIKGGIKVTDGDLQLYESLKSINPNE